MTCLFDYLNLIRIQQWYKNLVVFLALFFSGNLFNDELFFTTIIAFFSVSFISSAGYIINDIVDAKSDRLHPEKRHRPFASGRISLYQALFITSILLFSSVLLAILIHTLFLFVLGSIFGLMLLYTFFLKNIPLADILTVSSLFVLRAIAGAVAISVTISPWLVLVPFFLSLFLSIGKRHGEVGLLRENSVVVNEVLKAYTPRLTTSLMNGATTSLILSYALYITLGDHILLIYTLPVALFLVFRYYSLILSGSSIARYPEQVLKDGPMVLGIICFAVIIFLILYFPGGGYS